MVQVPVVVVGDGDLADAEDRGGHLDFPRPRRLDPCGASPLPCGLAVG